MSEIQHTNRAHARLNASSSHRWMMCPPSVKLSEQFEDKPSTYAEEGTYLLSTSIRYQSISRRHIVRRRKEVHFAG